MDQFLTMLDEIADLTTSLQKHQVKLDKAILEVREQFGTKVEQITDLRAAKMALCEAYAMRNRDAILHNGAKSSESVKATFGFRLGNPTLVLLNKKHTWKTVCSKLSELSLEDYLTVPDPKPDKDRIKADFDDSKLALLGLRIKQDESFWVQPKNDTQERIQ